ncbi:MAG TPA: hypothetical protein VMC42_03865 [Methanoregulaceae archaeon]|nr:hypothetical protein [Methanoregulaceae archaeon]
MDPNFSHCPPFDPEKELIHVDCASHTDPDGSVGIGCRHLRDGAPGASISSECIGIAKD